MVKSFFKYNNFRILIFFCRILINKIVFFRWLKTKYLQEKLHNLVSMMKSAKCNVSGQKGNWNSHQKLLIWNWPKRINLPRRHNNHMLHLNHRVLIGYLDKLLFYSSFGICLHFWNLFSYVIYLILNHIGIFCMWDTLSWII